MKYVTRTFVAMVLFAFCWVAVGYGIYQLLGVGTCASGGPYVSARPCPAGIERLMFALIGGVLGLLLAAVIYARRGRPPGSARPQTDAAVVIWFWTGLFWSLAAGSFLAVWGPDASPGPGAKTGGLIVGFMGLVMGAGGLLALKFSRRSAAPSFVNPAFTRIAGAATRFSGAADPVSRLDVLARLRAQGMLTEAEFETLKSKIVGEP
jgi:hypothetical protein